MVFLNYAIAFLLNYEGFEDLQKVMSSAELGCLFTKKEVEIILHKYSPNIEFKIHNYTVKKASIHMLGFLAQHYRLNVEYFSGSNHTIFRLTFFIKAIPRVYDNEDRLRIMRTHVNKEKAVYEKILIDFGGDEGTDAWRPKLVASFKNEMVFQDLSTLGYEMKDKLQCFDKEHCLIALSSLAKFHAKSIIIEECKTRETGQTYRLQEHFNEYLDEASYRANGLWFPSGMSGAFYAIAEFSKFGKVSTHFPKVEAEWQNFVSTGIALANPDNVLRNVICHRDLWTNNLMFHYNDTRTPDGCIILDYQAVRCQPPAADVMAFIYLNTHKSFRKDNLLSLQNYYYEQIKEELHQNHIIVENIFTPHAFSESCERYRKWALISSAALGPQIWIDNYKLGEVFCDSNAFITLLNVDRRELIKTMMNNESYKHRVLDILEEIVELFLI